MDDDYMITLDEPPSCAVLGNDGRIAIGSLDGSIDMAQYSMEDERVELKNIWKFAMKAAPRALKFGHDDAELYTVSVNKAVCSFDVETGKRTRCIKQGHNKKPTDIVVLPTTASRKQQIATGDEEGQIKTWDFRASDPVVCTYKDQEEDVNAMAMDYKHNLLSVSSDGTLAAYDVRKCKLRAKSEAMHSELLSLCVTDKYVYAGGGDGYLEAFKHGDYGNIVERVETAFDLGANQAVELRCGLLLTSNDNSNQIALLNVLPPQKLGMAGTHADEQEIDQLLVSPDRSTLVSVSTWGQSIKFWPLDKLLSKVPILRSADLNKKKRKKVKVAEGFFDGIMGKADGNKKKKKRKDSDSEDDEEDEEEEDSDADFSDEGDSDDDSDEQPQKKKRKLEDSEEDEDSDDEEGEFADSDSDSD